MQGVSRGWEGREGCGGAVREPVGCVLAQVDWENEAPLLCRLSILKRASLYKGEPPREFLVVECRMEDRAST